MPARGTARTSGPATDFRQVFSGHPTRTVAPVKQALRTAWGILRSTYVLDLLFVVAVMVPLLASDGAPRGSVFSPTTFQLVAGSVLVVSVLVARRLPLVAALAPAALGLGVTGNMFTDQLGWAQLLLAFLLGRRTTGRQAAYQLVASLGLLSLVFVLTTSGTTGDDWFSLGLEVLLMFVLPWTAGQYVRQHADLLRAGWELAERLEREHDLVADQVRLRERTRIAGDMHDSLGHELSLIAMRAAALQVSLPPGSEAHESADELRDAASAATDRLHRIIGILRGDDDGPPVVPALDTVDDLVDRAVASGVDVTLTDTGSGAGVGTEQLPEATTRALYRVVQESLTNTTKHAPGAPVTVALRRDGDDVVVRVANDTPPVPLAASADVMGYGLVGLDERVRLVGGTLDARSTPDGGFAVVARLPGTADAAATPPVTTPIAHHTLAAARRRLRYGMIGAFWAPALVIAILVLLYTFDVGRL